MFNLSAVPIKFRTGRPGKSNWQKNYHVRYGKLSMQALLILAVRVYVNADRDDIISIKEMAAETAKKAGSIQVLRSYGLKLWKYGREVQFVQAIKQEDL